MIVKSVGEIITEYKEKHACEEESSTAEAKKVNAKTKEKNDFADNDAGFIVSDLWAGL